MIARVDANSVVGGVIAMQKGGRQANGRRIVHALLLKAHGVAGDVVDDRPRSAFASGIADFTKTVNSILARQPDR